jgi:site-specific DNA-methyltransferase (adenine-specific)
MPPRAPRNRTISCTEAERERLARRVIRLDRPVSGSEVSGQIVAGDIFSVAKYLPAAFVDLLILDPPYNITKDYGGSTFRKRPADEYRRWFQALADLLVPLMKPDATLYVCSDWSTSTLIYPVLETSFQVRNRITWERDKGRGAKRNWKNNTEDI